jgi:predicted Zn finger-like uncharacterized protein
MILTCASCATRYYADDALIGPNGRSVRCASCGHTWFAEPQLVLHDASAPAASGRRPPLTREQVERMRRQAPAEAVSAASSAARYRQMQAERIRRDRRRAAVVAWGATGAAMAATAAGAVALRDDVAGMWPESASAFTALGLDVNLYGLEIYDLTVTREFDGPTPVLLVSGEVRNIGRDDKSAPPIRLTLRDQEGHAVFDIVHTIPPATIAAGGATPFAVRLANPPMDAVDLEASFLAPGQTAPEPVDHETPLELGHDNLAPAGSDDGHAPEAAPTGAHDPHAADGPHALNLRERYEEYDTVG